MTDLVITLRVYKGVLGFINVYFDYIKILCKIFAKYIMPTLKFYPNHLIIFLKIITTDIFINININIILNTCIKNLKYQN